MHLVKSLLSDALHLFFPHYCEGCGSDVLPKDQQLCLYCNSQLPYTGFELINDNPIEKIFQGRIDIVAAASCFYFSKGHVVQHLIHQLKYKGNREVGVYLGKLMGERLLQSEKFRNLDFLLPLPLYPDKEFKRGYNQSALLCQGMAGVMNVPVMLNNVIRQRQTATQTKKHRAERWENVAGSFAIRQPEKLEGKRALLVDDVVTTGATLEACAEKLVQVPGLQLSFATLAAASK